jgi:hypothetical protein
VNDFLLQNFGLAIEMSVRDDFVETTTVSSWYAVSVISLEESASQEQKYISNQRSKELRTPSRRDNKCRDHWNEQRTYYPATHKDSKPEGTKRVNTLK